jgi:predicted TPR repeat methyltransferase
MVSFEQGEWVIISPSKVLGLGTLSPVLRIVNTALGSGGAIGFSKQFHGTD